MPSNFALRRIASDNVPEVRLCRAAAQRGR